MSSEDYYYQSWALQFVKPEPLLLLFPLCFDNEVKTIVDSVHEAGKESLRYTKVDNFLCFAELKVKPSSPSLSRKLMEKLIPHCASWVKKQGSRNIEDAREMNWCYWEYTNNEPKSYTAGFCESDNQVIQIMHMAAPFNWGRQIKHCMRLKTLQLIKGKSNVVPEITLESSYWSSVKR